jgi:hypothetical protein
MHFQTVVADRGGQFALFVRQLRQVSKLHDMLRSKKELVVIRAIWRMGF